MVIVEGWSLGDELLLRIVVRWGAGIFPSFVAYPPTHVGSTAVVTGRSKETLRSSMTSSTIVMDQSGARELFMKIL